MQSSKMAQSLQSLSSIMPPTTEQLRTSGDIGSSDSRKSHRLLSFF